MESNFKKFVNDNKGFVVFYLIWFLINLLFISVSKADDDGFWPFEDSDFDAYSSTEFLFYLIVPIVIWGIWKLVGKDIKNSFDENN